MRDLRCLALVAVVGCLAGCAGVLRTEGTSGPVAWRATNFAVTEKRVGPAQDQLAEAQTFDLIIKNVSDRTITLTEWQRTVYAPGMQAGTARVPVQLKMKPGAEEKIPLASFRSCDSLRGCIDSGPSQALWRMIFTGTDEDNRPVDVRFDIAPPAETTRMINTHPAAR